MALRDKKFLLIVATLIILASCAKKPAVETSTGSDAETAAAEEQLLNDINEAIDSAQIDTGTGTQITASGTTSTETDTKVVKLSGKYTTPGGNDEAEFTLTLDGDKINSVTIKTIHGNEITHKMQGLFGGAINEAIAGKTLAEAETLVAVGGASLTTKAFVAAIKAM